MKDLLKRKELALVWGVLIGFFIMLLSPSWGCIVMGAAVGYGFAQFQNEMKKK